MCVKIYACLYLYGYVCTCNIIVYLCKSTFVFMYIIMCRYVDILSGYTYGCVIYCT